MMSRVSGASASCIDSIFPVSWISNFQIPPHPEFARPWIWDNGLRNSTCPDEVDKVLRTQAVRALPNRF